MRITHHEAHKDTKKKIIKVFGKEFEKEPFHTCAVARFKFILPKAGKVCLNQGECEEK